MAIYKADASLDDAAKTTLLEILRDAKQNVRVTFTKKDGSERVMSCTLAESRIPEDKRPKTQNTKTSDEVCAVFDSEVMEWRSFRWESLVTFETI
jgi:hypothetical protein